MTPTRSKYRAKRTTTADGITHDSKAEAMRWETLKLMQRAGEISDLQRQVPFEIAINGQHVCKYIADFVYHQNGARVVEDTKGMKTDVYRLKRKLMLAVHGVEILETGLT